MSFHRSDLKIYMKKKDLREFILPLNPLRHKQYVRLYPITQVPPFKQGSVEHGFTKVSEHSDPNEQFVGASLPLKPFLT